ncbi:hypothetical protein IT781_03825 [Methylobacter sp. BlB1]|nr:hypothetical protein [Methylobacter sp. BlB1]
MAALCPGAEHEEAKRWQLSHYAEVTCQLIEYGWQVWLLGSGKDQAVTDQIYQLAGAACLDFVSKIVAGIAKRPAIMPDHVRGDACFVQKHLMA